MVIGKKQEPSLTAVDINAINGHSINTTEELKLLGVTIDKELHFSKHIFIICKKVSKLIGVLMRLRKLIPTEAKLQTYKTEILPHRTYCNLVWHFCKATDEKKLERVNERRLRAVFCDWNLADLLKRANLFSQYISFFIFIFIASITDTLFILF